jgi:hypothetical protein
MVDMLDIWEDMGRHGKICWIYGKIREYRWLNFNKDVIMMGIHWDIIYWGFVFTNP